MKAFLRTTAVIEITVGLALLLLPEVLASILVGAPLGTFTGVLVARLAGAALLSLGVACFLGSGAVLTRTTWGIAVGMLIYNIAASGLLLSARYGAGMRCVGLLPAAVLHALLGIWCVACLRSIFSGGPEVSR